MCASVRYCQLTRPDIVLAFLALAVAPVPFLFQRYGPFLRRNSKFVPSSGLARSALQPLQTTQQQIEEKSNMHSPASTGGATTAVSSRPPPGILDTVPSFRSPNPSPTPSRSHTPQAQSQTGDLSVSSGPMGPGRSAPRWQGQQATTYGRVYSGGYGERNGEQRDEEVDVGMSERGPLMR